MENGMKISASNMEDARMEWKTIFHTNSILNFEHGIYRKMYTDVGSIKQYSHRSSQHVLHTCIIF